MSYINGMTLNKKSERQSVGQRIRGLRLGSNMTQDQLAARVGVSRAAVTQWETNRANQLGENLRKVAEVFNTSLGYLVTGETGVLLDDELSLIQLYRACKPADRKLLLLTAKRLTC